MGAIITLTTDLGLTDAYVAAMKGVILNINPEAVLIDVCHDIEPQNIAQAAFALSTVYQYFPRKTIHIVVVDPEVGTERRAVILRTPLADFVAPDNGVLSYMIREFSHQPMKDTTNRQQIELGPEIEAIAITRPRYWLSPLSATFHGRDIFAPVAARLSLGTPPILFGQRLTHVTVLPPSQPQPTPDGKLVGHILHIDRFGNLITDIKGDELPETKKLINVEIGSQLIAGVSRNYTESKGLLALIGSSGYLEIALKDGNARDFLHAAIGDKVVIGEKEG